MSIQADLPQYLLWAYHIPSPESGKGPHIRCTLSIHIESPTCDGDLTRTGRAAPP
ncbi:hypothetical protein [Roseimaritima multifibrata]|uniref:hypothetical protein n=1 Tax=Roseimaritima multifibrata TaxID=1930274 RepID=UPI001C54C521|nr:hypothetical protein [Roseimaritima multifibrata]